VRTVPHISYARSADGVSLAFTVAGNGPALVFVPWVPFSNLRMEWQNPMLHRVFEQLSRRLTVIHYDGRGTGHSQRDVADLSLDAMISDLEAVVDRVGAAQVSLLGQYNSCPHAIAGESNRQIARRLGLSTHTVERHVANLYRKIGARGRADATAYALRNGLG